MDFNPGGRMRHIREEFVFTFLFTRSRDVNLLLYWCYYLSTIIPHTNKQINFGYNGINGHLSATAREKGNNMALTLDLTKEEETRLVAAAKERGTAPAETLKRLIQEHLPPVREAPFPNEKALATLRDIAKLKEGIPESDGSQTDQMIREARAGATYDRDR